MQKVRPKCDHGDALVPGFALIAVGDERLPMPFLNAGFPALLERLRTAPRPLPLTFRRVLLDDEFAPAGDLSSPTAPAAADAAAGGEGGGEEGGGEEGAAPAEAPPEPEVPVAERMKKYEAKTWVHSIFEGVTTTETRCCNCDTVTSRDEAFLDLSIEIEQDSQSKDGTSVQACLDAFTNEEDLKDEGKEGGDNRFFCDRCKSLQDAKKAMRIARCATRRATRRAISARNSARNRRAILGRTLALV